MQCVTANGILAGQRDLNRATGAILEILTSKKGMLTTEALAPEVMKAAGVTREVYNIAINQLIAAEGVVRDKQMRLYPATNPPSEKELLKK